MGAWARFITGAGADDFLSPAVSLLVRGNGQVGWFGWLVNAELEALYLEVAGCWNP